MIKYTEEIKKMNIYEKISAISAEVEYLQKDDVVGAGMSKYKAISIEKVVAAVAEKLNKYGVVICPTEQEYTRKDEEIVRKDGTTGYNRISDVRVKYSIINIHNPQEQVHVASAGCGVDTQDKGIGKAMTYAYKNMIIRTFAIAVGDDTDKIHSAEYTSEVMRGAVQAKLTDAQIKRLYAVAWAKGVTKEIVDASVKAKMKCDVKDLNKNQYDKVVAAYQSM